MARSTLLFRMSMCLALALALVFAAGVAGAGEKAAKKADAKAADAKAAADKSAKPGDAKPAMDAESEAMMAEMMKLANPGPEHAALSPLIGKWKSSMKSWMMPGEPQTSEGTCERQAIMGGRYLVCHHHGVFGGMPFEGMEILAYDNLKKQYVSTWIDNMGTGIAMSHGGVLDPATKTLTMNMSMTDYATRKDVPYRTVTKIVDDNMHVFTMVTNKDGKDVTEMEITYSRIK